MVRNSPWLIASSRSAMMVLPSNALLRACSSTRVLERCLSHLSYYFLSRGLMQIEPQLEKTAGACGMPADQMKLKPVAPMEIFERA